MDVSLDRGALFDRSRPTFVYDDRVDLSPARVLTTLRAFALAVKQMAEGYAQGPPGC